MKKGKKNVNPITVTDDVCLGEGMLIWAVDVLGSLKAGERKAVTAGAKSGRRMTDAIMSAGSSLKITAYFRVPQDYMLRQRNYCIFVQPY